MMLFKAFFYPSSHLICVSLFLSQTRRRFEVNKAEEKDNFKIFSVPDFVGDACKAIASRIRGAVAGVQFDDFHKVSHLTRLECFFLFKILKY